ncbi:MAG: CCA tRNA nucleotidyltransferase [Clostridiaceae bacterium]|nr:CCA tRNA nucleotidyltransferase [Clostridiaceae bacterium]
MLPDKQPLFIPDPIRRLIDQLNGSGFACFVVGGYLRDLILQRPTHDYDLATSATPEQVAEVFSSYRTIPTGLAHGTMTVIAGEETVEVTTFRKEGSYSDFRHPDEVWFTGSIEDDLARRDFTINAMAWHPEQGLIDPWDGRADLEGRLIRAVGEAEKRFEEDALRVLRALRFSSELGFEIEPSTRRALGKASHLLQHIAPERIRIEMERLLAGPNLADVLDTYAPVMAEAIPVLAALQSTQAGGDESLYEIAIKRMANVSPDPLKRMAALLYDIGEASRADTAASVAQALRFSKKDTENISLLVASKTEEMAQDERAVWRLLRRWGESSFSEVMEIRTADARARYAGDKGRQAIIEAVGRVAEDLIAAGRNLSLADLAVDGRDLIKRGFRGPAIGSRLESLLEAVCVDGIANRKDTLLKELDRLDAEIQA